MMGFVVKNVILALRFCLSVLKFVGFLEPKERFGYYEKIYYNVYWVLWFIFLVGALIIAQTGVMFQVWGDITLMTNAACLLLTNLALATKVLNVVTRRAAIQDIIARSDDELRSEDREEGVVIVKSCNREITISLCVYLWFTYVTVIGWGTSAEKGQLPLKAWYPYDTSKSPAYELTYLNQCTALSIAALVNVSFDMLVVSLIAVCRCRLMLVGLSLRTLCDSLSVDDKQSFNSKDEAIVIKRLQLCVMKHEAVLKTSRQLQQCFSLPVFAQFSVSILIICVTAYQLALDLKTKNWVRLISMISYLLCMMLQVFLYCYQGNQLTEESSNISDAAYWCPWYRCSVRLRRGILITMVRTRRVAQLTAGGITTLSLACFTSIIKVSYTFFTVLQQVEDRIK